jgi:predicted permease
VRDRGTQPARVGRRALRLLLRLYPAAFRRALGDDLVETVLERRRAARSHGARNGLGFWLTDVPRFAVDGVLERLAALAQLGHDARGAFRQARRAPGFHLLVVATIALGIAASTAMFTVADAVVFRPLPYPGARDLYAVHSRFGPTKFSSSSPATFVALRDANRAFAWVLGARDRSPALTAPGPPERVFALDVTEGYLDHLGARVVLGRTLQPDDHRAGSAPVAVLSWPLWQRRFGGDRAVVGTSLSLDDGVVTVVGVLEPGFRDPSPLEAGSPTSLWMPLRADAPLWSDHEGFVFSVLARRAPEVPLEAAAAEGRRVGALLAEERPDDYVFNGAPLELVLEPLRDLTVGSEARLRVLLVLAASGLLLALACVNVANLLLSRSEGRRIELATRCALGASDSRIAGQLVAESVSLACFGGALGLGLGALALRGFRSIAPDDVPRLHEVGLDLRAVAFALLAALLTGVAFGAIPALRASRTFPGSASRATSGRAGVRTQATLVGVQTALALTLVAGSALLLGSFRNLLHTDPGFRPEDLVVVDLRPPGERGDVERHRAFYDELHERAAALPGVERAALSYTVPGKPGGAFSPIRAAGASLPEVPSFHQFNPIQGDYFETLGVRLLGGRTFDGTEGADGPLVVVVNQRAAATFFPGIEDPVGERLLFSTAAGAAGREVIGVVGDVRQRGPAEEPQPEVYVPSAQGSVGRLLLTLRLAPGLEPPVDEIRSLVAELAPGTPIDDVSTMSQWLARTIAVQRFLAILVSAFGAIALLLAVVGTYSTARCAATRRLRELGIRQALGAERRDLVLRATLRTAGVAAAGALGGLALTAVVARWLEGNLHGLSALDARTLASTALLLLAAAALAALGPAWRAARMDPMRVLGADP